MVTDNRILVVDQFAVRSIAEIWISSWTDYNHDVGWITVYGRKKARQKKNHAFQIPVGEHNGFPNKAVNIVRQVSNL